MNIHLFPWHIKIGIKDFCEKHHGSIIIPEMVNDALRCGKKVIASQCFDATSVLTKGMIIFCW